MNDVQENKRSMAITVQSILATFRPQWTANAAFSRQAAALTDVLTAIDGTNLVQESDRTGITIDKRELKTAAAEQTDDAADLIQAFALENDNDELYESMGFTATQLVRMRDTRAADKMAEVLGAAQANAEALLEFGLAARDITDLQAAIRDYVAARDNPQAGRAERASATEALSGHFATLDAVLLALDKNIAAFRKTAPEFVRQYRAARVVVNNRGPQGSTPPPPPQP